MWITETQQTPDLSDLLYASSILPLVVKVIFILAMIPLVGPVVWFVDTFVVPIFLPIWRLDYSIVLSALSTQVLPFVNRLPTFVTNNLSACIAPLVWFAVIFYSWRQLCTVTQIES